MKPRLKQKQVEALFGYLFAAAPLLQLLIFLVVPLGISFWLSFQQWDMLSAPTSVGLENYRDLMKDEKFWKSLGNTVYLMIGIPIGLALSLFLAVLMNRKMKGTNLFRVLYYIPAVCSVVASAQMWIWIFNADSGLVNTLLWNLFRIHGPYWFGDAHFTKIPMIVMGVWAGTGPTILFFLAGLQSIPQALYEAADVDGAKAMEKFWNITVPKLTPTIFYLVVMGVIGGLQGMAQSYVMYGSIAGTSGGPGYSAATVLYYLWESAFSYFQMGYASAIAWVVGLIIFALTWVNFKVSNKWVVYD